jgi:hypothetical protein
MFYSSFQGSVGRVCIYTVLGSGLFLVLTYAALEVVKWAPVAVANLAPVLGF